VQFLEALAALLVDGNGGPAEAAKAVVPTDGGGRPVLQVRPGGLLSNIKPIDVTILHFASNL
jgi:hypothetical protein